jgi:all-trans-8'-apo-beta-carotenal 15,15'-oxygenase
MVRLIHIISHNFKNVLLQRSDGQNLERMVQHPFEADGGVLGITFQGNGTVTTRFRYVRTIAFTNERRKGQRLYKAMDSTRELGYGIAEGIGNEIHTPLYRHHLLPGLNKKRKNTSNTRVVYWGKRLLSMWEGGAPYKLDGLALSTEGRSQLGGVLAEKDPFGSKMVIDPVKDRALMYKVVQDAKSSELTVYEFNNKFRLVEEGEKGEEGKSTVDLPGLAMISDMAVTTNYALFVQPKVSTSMQFMFAKEPGKVLSTEKAPAILHLVPRVGSNKEAVSLEIPFDGVVDANLQFINAYEEGNKVVLDAIRSDGLKKSSPTKSSEWPFVSSRADYDEKASNRSLWRYEIDLSSGTVSKRKLSDIQCFFGGVKPSQSTQKHDHIFMAIGGLGDDTAPPQGIAKFDCNSESIDSWMPEAYEFCGEPMFAPKVNPSSENDGYVLTVLFNGKSEQSELVVFESSEISAGPVCRIPLGIGVPHGLHGCFTDSEEAAWSFEEIQRRAKLADKIESRGNRWNEVKSDFSGLGLRFDDMEEYFGDSFLS